MSNYFFVKSQGHTAKQTFAPSTC